MISLKKFILLLTITLIPTSFVRAANINSVTPVYIVPGETIVTINGSGFGESSANKYIYFGYYAAYPLSWSDSQIQVKAPYDIYSSEQIKISGLFKTGQTCSGGYCYDKTEYTTLTTQTIYLLPSVTETTKTIYNKGIFEVVGKYFGSSQGSLYINNSPCSILKWQNNYIKCQIPDISSNSSQVTYKIISPTSPGYEATGQVNYLPSISNDSYSFYQTYIKQSKINSVWDSYTGKGVVVAVIDSGVDINSPDLKNSMWFNHKESLNNKIDDDKNGYIDDYYGYNFIDNNADMSPKNSHGTMVAGIIAAKRNNNIGIAGIAPDARIMPLIVCSDQGCPTEATKKAIKYAVDNGANIINLSLGGDGSLGYDPSYDSVIQYAHDHGVLIVAAAGNGDTEGDGTRGQDMGIMKASPICNENQNIILGVGALKKDDKPTYWTNYSMKYVDISAPGEDIFSTTVPLFEEDSSWYNFADGTSFSSPIVAGVAALLKEKNPTWKNYEIMSHMISRSDDFSEGWNVYGKKLNAKNIFDNANPRAEISAITTNVIDGGNNKLIIKGKNFYSKMKVKLYNTQFTGYMPTNLASISSDTLEIDLSLWDAIKPSIEKYSISIDSDSRNNTILNAVEIKNIIKTQNNTSVNDNKSTTTILQNQGSTIIDIKLTNKLKGRILLQTESRGEAWYVSPADGKRYYMANGGEAYGVMRKLGIGINNKNFDKLNKDKKFAKNNTGKIFIKVDDLGKAYYIDFSGGINYLKDGTEAYRIMRTLGLGIKNMDIDKIMIGQLN